MAEPQDSHTLTVGLAQIAPVWLNCEQMLAKILEQAHTEVVEVTFVKDTTDENEVEVGNV
jgi:hypothetical protein